MRPMMMLALYGALLLDTCGGDSKEGGAVDSAVADSAVVDSADATVDTAPVDTDAGERCACDYDQDCVAACTQIGDVCARDGYPDGSERRYCRAPAGVGDGCKNQFDEYFIPCEPGLSCLVPDPSEDDTVSLCVSCAAQDFSVTGVCALPLGVFWDGHTCASYSGCSCQGSDCGAGFESIAMCESTVAKPCAPVIR